MSFLKKLNGAISRNHSLLCVALDPDPAVMPRRYQQASLPLAQQLEHWLKQVIADTADWVCAYKPTLGFYTALGSSGMDLLQALLQSIPPQIPVILDIKHGDLNSSSILAQTIFEAWGLDAVTLTPYPGQDLAAPFLVYPDKAVFIVCHTSNPGALILQDYPSEASPLYLRIVREAQRWGTPAQLALEVGTTDPEVLRRVRTIAPERLILLRSLWASPKPLDQFLLAGCNTHGAGLMIPVPQDWLHQDNLAQAGKKLRDDINQIRAQMVQKAPVCDLWLPNVCLLQQHPHSDLILQLYDLGCILFGEYVQASGVTLPYYVDLRKIISNPQIFDRMINAYAAVLQTLKFDRIAGIPYGSLPTATGLALKLNCPMIFPRKEVKAHGTRELVEGHYQSGETAVVVDDILISGKSAMQGAEKLQSVGLKVEDIVVFMDHEQGVREKLQARGYRSHAILTISEVAEILHNAGRLTDEQFRLFNHP